jgi:hypothetical protein
MQNATGQLSVALIAVVGSLLVACIAGGFSLLGLIISKEQEVSRFRQAWIDALRADIAALIAHAGQLQSFLAANVSIDLAEFWEATRDDYLELNQVSTRIKLRLNPAESRNKAILQSMYKMEALFKQLNNARSLEKMNAIGSALEKDASALLKKEWKRVKNGEPIYIGAKVLAAVIFLAAAIIFTFLLWKIYHAPPSA